MKEHEKKKKADEVEWKCFWMNEKIKLWAYNPSAAQGSNNSSNGCFCQAGQYQSIDKQMDMWCYYSYSSAIKALQHRNLKISTTWPLPVS